MKLWHCRSVSFKILDRYERRFFLPLLAILVSLLLFSCSGRDGAVINKLTSFSITITNSNVTNKAATGEIIETSTGGSVYATLPGGTDPVIAVDFTTDGGTTKVSGSTVTSPININLGTVTEIIVVDALGNQRIYTLDIRDSGLPSVFITTDATPPESFPGDKVAISGKCKIVGSTYASADAYAKIDLAETAITVQGRGNSTLLLPKKPYRINFPSKTSVLGLPTAKKWVLLANYADKSLMRNYVAFKTAEIMENMTWTPKTLPVDLYLNGAYQGSYSMGDQLEVGTTRLALDTTSAVPQAADTGYLLEVNMRLLDENTNATVPISPYPEDVYYFTTLGITGNGVGGDPPDGFYLDIKSPKVPVTTPEAAGLMTTGQMSFIKTWVRNTETALFTGVADGKPYTDYIDVPSFIDWLIIEELFKNTDSNFYSSVYMHKNTGGLLKMGPVWDFDLSAGNVDNDFAGYSDFLQRETSGWFTSFTPWYDTGLLLRTGIKAAIKARWIAKKADIEAKVFAEIDIAAARIARSQKMNFAKWTITDLVEDNGWGEWFVTPDAIKAATTFEAQVALYKSWMTARIAWMDTTINDSSWLE